jgi:hypothetical protein
MGGPSSIEVVVIGVGGALQTTMLQTIKPEGGCGDRMTAQSVDGKLWVENSIYSLGESHCCNSHIAVRQFRFHSKRLQVEEIASVPRIPRRHR